MSAAAFCGASLCVSGGILPDTDTLSQRESFNFCASAVQAECRGEIFSAFLKLKKLWEKYDFSENNDNFFLKNGNNSTKYLSLGILKFSAEY